MARQFKSWRSFDHFSEAVRTRSRFIRDAETSDFLDTVAATSRKRRFLIEKGTAVFRAREGRDIEPELYQPDESGDLVHFPERLIALPEKELRPLQVGSKDNRANPKGISAFYGASEHTTAIAEIRPWIGAYVSYGTFAATKILKVVNCVDNRQEKRPLYFYSEPTATKKEVSVWHDIDEAFSTPVGPNDDRADYIPSQILADLFRSLGFDGIAYRSSVAEGGINLVLFDQSLLTFVKSSLVQISKLKYEFNEDDGHWY